MKLRLAIAATGIALACTSCALLPIRGIDHGAAQATVSYQDDSGTQDIEVSIESIVCDVTRGTGGFVTAGEGSGQLVNATVNEGESIKLSIALGHDGLLFYSMEPFTINDEGAEFSGLPGEVIRTGDGDPSVVDSAATATGTCP